MFTEMLTGSDSKSLDGYGVAWGDYDNDGDLDLYCTYRGAGSNVLLRNEAAAGNHWLQVRLEGTISNASAIGARVRIVSGGQSQVREVSGGSGGYSQDSLPIEFGLGAATSVDTLIIRWPSGIVNTLTQGVLIDHLLVVAEAQGGATGVEPSARVNGNQLFAAIPNPFNPRTVIRFELEHATHVELRVFDVTGRLVTTLINEERSSGPGESIWQGRDSSGKQVASGVYLYQLRAGDFVQTKRMVLLK